MHGQIYLPEHCKSSLLLMRSQAQSLSWMSKRHDGLQKDTGDKIDSVLDLVYSEEDTAAFSIHLPQVNLGNDLPNNFLKPLQTWRHLMLRFSFVKAKAKPRPPNRKSASCPPASASESPRAFLHTVFACFDCISFWLGFKKKKSQRGLPGWSVWPGKIRPNCYSLHQRQLCFCKKNTLL